MAPSTRGSRKRKHRGSSQTVDADEISPRLELTTGIKLSRKEKKMAELWRSGSLCDISIVVENETFSAHRNVLAAGSDYMHALLCGNRFKDSTQDTITLTEMTSESFRLVLEWFYEGKCEVTESGLTDLLEVSSRLQCVDLLEKVEKTLIHRVETHNCLSLWDVAERMQLPELAKISELEALKCYPELINTPDFNMLPAARLSSFIGNDRLKVEKEEVVFESVLSWAKAQHNPPTAEELGDLFEKVRFPLMSEDFITTKVETEQMLIENQRGMVSLVHSLKEKLYKKKTKRTMPRRGIVPKCEDFKPGVQVRVKNDLELVKNLFRTDEFLFPWIQSMEEHIGKIATVSEMTVRHHDYLYLCRIIKLFHHWWPLDALEIVD